MRHESRLKLPFPTFLIVITFSHFGFSSYFKPFQKLQKPPIIKNANQYRKSISGDSLKQMVALQTFVPEIVIDLRYGLKTTSPARFYIKSRSVSAS
jgi:hypothetical protein